VLLKQSPRANDLSVGNVIWRDFSENENIIGCLRRYDLNDRKTRREGFNFFLFRAILIARQIPFARLCISNIKSFLIEYQVRFPVRRLDKIKIKNVFVVVA
jgi:hypothetical protein